MASATLGASRRRRCWAGGAVPAPPRGCCGVRRMLSGSARARVSLERAAAGPLPVPGRRAAAGARSGEVAVPRGCPHRAARGREGSPTDRPPGRRGRGLAVAVRRINRASVMGETFRARQILSRLNILIAWGVLMLYPCCWEQRRALLSVNSHAFSLCFRQTTSTRANYSEERFCF